MDVTFTYDPRNIGEAGKDRMRFELGDMLVENPMERYLSDEEITAVIESNRSWKRAKLALVESLLHRFAFEVDTRSGPVDWKLSQRYAAWEKLHGKLKSEVAAGCSVPSAPSSAVRPPYFHEGMHDNRPSGGKGRCNHVPSSR